MSNQIHTIKSYSRFCRPVYYSTDIWRVTAITMHMLHKYQESRDWWNLRYISSMTFIFQKVRCFKIVQIWLPYRFWYKIYTGNVGCTLIIRPASLLSNKEPILGLSAYNIYVELLLTFFPQCRMTPIIMINNVYK